MDPTELLATVEQLAEQVAGQDKQPTCRAEWIGAALALRNALDAIRDTVDDLDYDIGRRLTAESLVTKRCARPGCRKWTLVTTGKRRRRTCSDACRVALARSR